MKGPSATGRKCRAFLTIGSPDVDGAMFLCCPNGVNGLEGGPSPTRPVRRNAGVWPGSLLKKQRARVHPNPPRFPKRPKMPKKAVEMPAHSAEMLRFRAGKCLREAVVACSNHATPTNLLNMLGYGKAAAESAVALTSSCAEPRRMKRRDMSDNRKLTRVKDFWARVSVGIPDECWPWIWRQSATAGTLCRVPIAMAPAKPAG